MGKSLNRDSTPRKMSTTVDFPVTLNCNSYSDNNNCGNVKDATNATAFCKNGADPANGDTCLCGDNYGTTNTKCAKADGGFTCAGLNEEACKIAGNCELTNGKCECSSTMHLVAGTNG